VLCFLSGFLEFLSLIFLLQSFCNWVAETRAKEEEKEKTKN